MKITLNDTRNLAVAIVRLGDGKYHDWSNEGWTAPFNPAHLRPLVRLEPAPGLWSTVQSVDIGTVLLDRTDAAAVLVAVDGAGAPIAVADIWTLPSPVPSPCSGGFLRG
jgi:hypothetical protein